MTLRTLEGATVTVTPKTDVQVIVPTEIPIENTIQEANAAMASLAVLGGAAVQGVVAALEGTAIAAAAGTVGTVVIAAAVVGVVAYGAWLLNIRNQDQMAAIITAIGMIPGTEFHFNLHGGTYGRIDQPDVLEHFYKQGILPQQNL